MMKAIAGRAWPWPWVNVRNSPGRSRGGYEFMAENAAGRGHWDDALAFAARDHDEGRKSGSLARVAWSQFCTAQGLHGKGELAGARAAALSALELCARSASFAWRRGSLRLPRRSRQTRETMTPLASSPGADGSMPGN